MKNNLQPFPECASAVPELAFSFGGNCRYNKSRIGEKMAITLSVCMIVKDEESVIERCLRSVSKLADEIIILDTGSCDRTMEIAKNFNVSLYQHPWGNDFSEVRNISYSKASSDYIMWMDADDDIEEEDIEKLLVLKETMTKDIDVVFLSYLTNCTDTSLGFILLRDRIIRRNLNAKWVYPVHEGIEISPYYNTLYRDDIIIYHRKLRENEKRRNISIFDKAVDKGFIMNDFNKAFYCRESTMNEEYEKAIDLYEKMKKEGAHYKDIHYARFFYVESMKKLKRYTQLANVLEEEAGVFPEDENLYCFLGDALLWSKKEEEAEKYYLKALETKVDLSDLCMHDRMCHVFLPCVRLANIYARRGNTDKALAYYERGKALCPSSPLILHNEAYFEKLRKCKVKNVIHHQYLYDCKE